MQRIRLIIEYDGTAYSGWQRQENAMTVQEQVEHALFCLTKEKIAITGASRTDAGVHARGQNAHFDTTACIPPAKYAFALNTHLPPDIRVRASQLAAAGFHARFSAEGKRYSYRIHNHPHASALARNFSAHVALPLDLEKMRTEAAAILGTHDFAAFAASGSSVKDTVRTMKQTSVHQAGDEVLIEIEGSGFLYNMVRIFAGTLIGVGTGKLAPGAITRALAGKNRLELGATAPACGLTLEEIFYAE